MKKLLRKVPLNQQQNLQLKLRRMADNILTRIPKQLFRDFLLRHCEERSNLCHK